MRFPRLMTAIMKTRDDQAMRARAGNGILYERAGKSEAQLKVQGSNLQAGH